MSTRTSWQFTRFIERYITVNQRWNSPEVPVRRVVLERRGRQDLWASLQNAGVEFNGVTLLSSIHELQPSGSGNRCSVDRVSAFLCGDRVLPQEGKSYGKHGGVRWSRQGSSPRDLTRRHCGGEINCRQQISMRSRRRWLHSRGCSVQYVKDAKLQISAYAVPQGITAR